MSPFPLDRPISCPLLNYQMTLISLRILVGYAKSTHRSLAQLCRVPYQPRRERARPAVHADPNNASAEANPEAARVSELFQVDDDEGDDHEGGVLPWDPLGPRLLQEARRLAEEGKERPLTAAVVLAAALPFSGAAVFLGAPVLAGDAALQWGAATPMGRTVGHGTKNAVEVSEHGGCSAWAAKCKAVVGILASHHITSHHTVLCDFEKGR